MPGLLLRSPRITGYTDIEQFLLPAEPLYAMAYRPVRREDAAEIEVWSATLAVGRPLSLLPLDLGETYTEACERSR
jgi:hypothetical protein